MSSFLLATITINALFTLFPKQCSELRKETDKHKRNFSAIFGSIADILSSLCEKECELNCRASNECINQNLDKYVSHGNVKCAQVCKKCSLKRWHCRKKCKNCYCKQAKTSISRFLKVNFSPKINLMWGLPRLVGFFGYIFSFISWLASVLEKISTLWCCSALCAACCLLIENKQGKDLNYWYLLLISPVFIYALLLVMQFVSILLYEILGGTICSISYCRKAYIEARKQSAQILTSEIVEDVLRTESVEK